MIMENRKSAILLIYTGGTIGMKVDPKVQALKPFNFNQILEEVPELGKFAYRIDSYTFDPLIDSSEVVRINLGRPVSPYQHVVEAYAYFRYDRMSLICLCCSYLD